MIATLLIVSGVAIAFLLGLIIGAALVTAAKKQSDADQERLTKILAAQQEVVAKVLEAVRISHVDVVQQTEKYDQVVKVCADVVLQLQRRSMAELASGKSTH